MLCRDFLLYTFLILSILAPAYALSGEQFKTEKLLAENPKILYFSDTNHNSLQLLSVYSEMVSRIVATSSDYNCIFLESDQEIFQSAIDDFMNGAKSWEASVGKAQHKWEKITDRKYQKAPKAFLEKLKSMDLKVFAIDWSDNSLESELMKNQFTDGFKGDIVSLRRAFHWGVEIRNSVMATNILKLMTPSRPKNSPTCKSAIFFVGSLHLAREVEMPMGRTSYTSIADYSEMKKISQVAHEILDCNNIKSTSSQENREQCQSKTQWNTTVPDIFSPGNQIKVHIAPSLSGTAGAQIETAPSISYNIMISPI